MTFGSTQCHTTRDHRQSPSSSSDGEGLFVVGYAYAVSVILTATIRVQPTDHKTDVSELATDIITATADDYETAYAELVGKTPDGWQMLGIRRD